MTKSLYFLLDPYIFYLVEEPAIKCQNALLNGRLQYQRKRHMELFIKSATQLFIESATPLRKY